LEFVRILVFILGLWLVFSTLLSAVRSFVLPRSENVFLTRVVFRAVFRLLSVRLHFARSYAARDRIMALYSPIASLVLPVVWLISVLIGYTGMFWALGVGSGSLFAAFNASGSSLLTLGFALVDGWAQTALAFSEATIGLGMVALLIAYLPTMYAAFSRREALVNMLEIRAGSPPWAITMIERMHRLSGLEKVNDVWSRWEVWFVELEESHTSLAPLIFFRSPHPDRNWVIAAGAVLDAAALFNSTIDVPRNIQADLCIRAGYLALRGIADFFGYEYAADPNPDDPISITREEYDAAVNHLVELGVPIKPDREQTWRDFVGWRVNYDTVLLALCAVTMAPHAPWSSDRAQPTSRQK
jgi:hypothetical protein